MGFGPRVCAMAPHTLAPGISFGVIDGTAVVLDLFADRYRRLGPGATRTLVHLAEGREPGPGDDKPVAALVEAGILARGAGGSPVAPVALETPLPSALDDGPADMSPSHDFIRSVPSVLAVALSLKSKGFVATIDATRRYRASRAVLDRSDQATECARRFARDRAFLPFDRSCVPYALALSRVLSKGRLTHDVVFGASLTPFRAHAWVQTQTHILSDHSDTIVGLVPVFRL